MPKEDKDKEIAEVDEVNATEPKVEEITEEIPAEQQVSAEPTEESNIDNTIVDDSVQTIPSDGSVTVQQVKFTSFEDLGQAQGEINKNLDILMDIKLQLTVELGRTELPIKKVLELTRGSIVELEKVAGEPVELYANGKLVAHGEVVVIEDNFGLRITSITEPEDRLKGI